MPVTRENLHDVIRYQAPTEEQVSNITEIRNSSIGLIAAILDGCPDCADRTAAIRKVREAMMTANAAIVLNGKV